MSLPAPSAPPERVDIQLGERSYPILIGTGLLDDPQSFAAAPAAASALIVSNTTVAPLYAKALRAALAGRFRTVHMLELPDGEVHKNLQTLNLIFDDLLGHGSDRKTVLFALGGGVVGDMTGFAAASYMRGVPFVQVPTTLLAQVDSSVGGKTAINHPLGKNMIGAFYQPQLVVCDLATLQTLPPRELSAGLAEVIKYGPIHDMAFFDWIEANIDALVAREPAALAYAVKRSCEIKALVVGQDERETGLRAILNFGHTFGHALEAETGYTRLLHGEAVAWGMRAAIHLGESTGYVSAEDAVDMLTLIEAYGPIPRLDGIRAEKLFARLVHDKKTVQGKVHFVLPVRIGEVTVVSGVDERRVMDAIGSALA